MSTCSQPCSPSALSFFGDGDVAAVAAAASSAAALITAALIAASLVLLLVNFKGGEFSLFLDSVSVQASSEFCCLGAQLGGDWDMGFTFFTTGDSFELAGLRLTESLAFIFFLPNGICARLAIAAVMNFS